MSFKRNFAGVDYVYPQSGDKVLILQGEHEGSALEVDSIRGNAFSKAYMIHVISPTGVVWYWPWNVEVLSKK